MQPIPQEGYWTSYESVAHALKVYECTRGTCSGAADDAACWTATNYSTCDASEIQCSRGATGVLCGACQPEFTFNKIQNACVTCYRSQTVAQVRKKASDNSPPSRHHNGSFDS